MRRILFFVFAVVLLASCQKEVDDLLGSGGGTGGGGGNNTPSDYQPVSANSEWDYLSTTNGPSHIVALGTDT
ncbi:MAG TPA: membrane lipoprotein lipid attachment site-containing protein, partial [Chitinophagaceae bacterium]|nr:membrane lipoprotein lipid attachment site-containing protein [Chitinophagaceae bacterium]